MKVPAHRSFSSFVISILIFFPNGTCKRGGRLQALVQTIRSFELKDNGNPKRCTEFAYSENCLTVRREFSLTLKGKGGTSLPRARSADSKQAWERAFAPFHAASPCQGGLTTVVIGR
jgi:hypothetical protein